MAGDFGIGRRFAQSRDKELGPAMHVVKGYFPASMGLLEPRRNAGSSGTRRSGHAGYESF